MSPKHFDAAADEQAEQSRARAIFANKKKAEHELKKEGRKKKEEKQMSRTKKKEGMGIIHSVMLMVVHRRRAENIEQNTVTSYLMT